MRLVSILLVGLCLSSQLAMAEPSRLVAVLPAHAPASTPKADVAAFDNAIRAETARSLSPAGYLVLTEDVQLRVLEDNGLSVGQIAEACEKNCALSVARELKAGYFVTSVITQTSDHLFVGYVRFYDGESGAMISSTSALESNSFGGLRSAWTAQAAAFFELGLRQLKSELKFRAASQLARPAISLKRETSATRINMKVEAAFDKALEAEESTTASAEDRAAAWCRLSDLTEDNPYLDRATQTCRTEQHYVQQLKNVEEELERDYASLRDYLQLPRRTPEQKLAAVDAFLSVYRSFDSYLMVTAVNGRRSAIERGETVSLPAYKHASDADDDGVPDKLDRCPMEFGVSYRQGCQASFLEKHSVLGPAKGSLGYWGAASGLIQPFASPAGSAGLEGGIAGFGKAWFVDAALRVRGGYREFYGFEGFRAHSVFAIEPSVDVRLFHNVSPLRARTSLLNLGLGVMLSLAGDSPAFDNAFSEVRPFVFNDFFIECNIRVRAGLSVKAVDLSRYPNAATGAGFELGVGYLFRDCPGG